jgi:hypothetical protein
MPHLGLEELSQIHTTRHVNPYFLLMDSKSIPAHSSVGHENCSQFDTPVSLRLGKVPDWIGDWVSPRADLDVVVKRRIAGYSQSSSVFPL